VHRSFSPTTPIARSRRPPACTPCRPRSTNDGSTEGLPEFGLGIGLSTGEVAAALLGSEERLEYTLVGDTVNLSQRLQQFASAGETVLSEPTLRALTAPTSRRCALDAQLVKGRDTPVRRLQDPWLPSAHDEELH
jgi:adenylate cyclase